MKHGVVCIIKKKPCENKIKQFLYLLSLSSGDFHLCVVSNGFPEIREIVRKSGIKDYTIYNNSGNPPYSLMLNQGLKNCSPYKYTTCFNGEYSIVNGTDWIESINEHEFDLGGFQEEFFINTQNDSVKEVISKASNGDSLEWLIRKMHGDRRINVINKNIFTVNNEALKKIGYFKHIEDFMLEFNLRFYSNELAVKSIKEIYSVDSDFYRKDISNKINQGAKILYPVVVNKIRQRFVEKS